MLTDTHCHLDLNKFDADRADVLRRAREAGLGRILIPGITLKSSQSVVALAQSYEMLYAGVGVHPTDALTWNGHTLDGLRALASEAKVAAIGEIGLDYYWHAAPEILQQRVLKEQLGLAAETQKPAVIHVREEHDAEDGACAEDLIKILEEWTTRLSAEKNPLADRPGVFHSFSGSRQTAEKAIHLHFYIGVTAPITYKNADRRRETIASLPLENLLIETDAPFLAPVPHRGNRNEPAYVALIADKIAEIHATTREQVAAITTANAARLFGWGG